MLESMKKWDVALLTVAAGLALAHALHFNHTCDDAYIAFRYADNLARGRGLVFNPGEYVMGYSSFLWVCLLAFARVLGIDILLTARVLGTLCSWGTLVMVYAHVKRHYRKTGIAVLAVGVLVANGTFALWMFGGLEGPLFSLLLTVSVLMALACDRDGAPGRFALLGIMLGLSALTRPEGIFYAVLIVGWIVLRRFLPETRVEGGSSGPSRPDNSNGEQEDGRRLREVLGSEAAVEQGRRGVWGGGDDQWKIGVLTSLGIAAASYLCLSLWMYYYYGDPLPNTYYAKALPLTWPLLDRAWQITLMFLQSYYYVPVAIVGLWVGTRKLSLRSPGWLPFLLLTAFVVFFFRIGGDLLVFHRMWLWTLPLLALLLAETAAQFLEPETRSRRIASALVGGMLILLSLPVSFVGFEIDYLRVDDRFLDDLVVLARTLRAETPPDVVVAANNVGILSYESDRRILDMLGLTNRHIAKAPGREVGTPGHESHDGAYVLDCRPELIFLGMPRVLPRPATLEDDPGRLYPSDVDLIWNPRFRSGYELVNLSLPDGRYAPVFRRRKSLIGSDQGEK